MEATPEDVEFPETVILVGSKEWRCISCNACWDRDASIDDHVDKHHGQSKQLFQGQSKGLTTLKDTVPKKNGEDIMNESHSEFETDMAGENSCLGESGATDTDPSQLRGKTFVVGTRAATNDTNEALLASKRRRTETEAETELPTTHSNDLQAKIKPVCYCSDNTNVNDESSECMQRSKDGDITVDSFMHQPLLSAKQDSAETNNFSKDAIKAKYVVIVGKAGTFGLFDDDAGTRGNDDSGDLCPPIEMPSLQADAVFPPVISISAPVTFGAVQEMDTVCRTCGAAFESVEELR
jgi:hypothetical protein